MEKAFNDMSSDEKIVYLVDGLKYALMSASLEARKALRPSGFTPETAKEFPLLALIEGTYFGQHESGGALDWLEQLRSLLADDYGIENLYEFEDEDDEESDEDESDELEEVEA